MVPPVKVMGAVSLTRLVTEIRLASPMESAPWRISIGWDVFGRLAESFRVSVPPVMRVDPV